MRGSKVSLLGDSSSLPASRFDALFDRRRCFDALRRAVVERYGTDVQKLKEVLEKVERSVRGSELENETNLFLFSFLQLC